MLVELLLASVIISTTLLAAAGMLSNFRLGGLRTDMEQRAVQLAQDELERVLACQKEEHAWFWANPCTGSSPCHMLRKPSGWWLANGSTTYGDYTVETWFSETIGQKEKKILTVRITWAEYGRGQISRKILVTNPE